MQVNAGGGITDTLGNLAHAHGLYTLRDKQIARGIDDELAQLLFLGFGFRFGGHNGYGKLNDVNLTVLSILVKCFFVVKGYVRGF